LGGSCCGYFVVGAWQGHVPVPAGGRREQLHLRGRGRPDPADAAHLPWREILAQVGWIAAGLLLIVAATSLMHE
jgi:hypothetical protein